MEERIYHPRGYDRPTEAEAAEATAVEEAGPIPHRHSYRKDGTCACGHVRRERKSK